MLMQRFRSILHLVDPILENGHSLCFNRGRYKFNLEKHRIDPWDIHAADVNSMKHLIQNFGLRTSKIDQVTWTKDKHAPCDLVITTDNKGVHKGRTTKGLIAIPYMGFNCYTAKGCVTTGNPMCQEIRTRQKTELEKKGTVLIIHPGGGRDFLSPKRKRFDSPVVINNNIELMNKTISYLPKSVSEIVIKTHPAPYLTCDCASMISGVLPHIKANCPVTIVENDLIGLICKSEFIINFGSSTSIWLLGSPKKWINIIDQAQFNLKSKNRRDKVERAENWWSWPQNVTLENIGLMLEEYDTRVDRSLPFMKKYEELYGLNTISKCVKLIEKFGR
jgi:hypothetical protein